MNTHLKTHTHTPHCLYKFLYSRVTQTSQCLGILPLALDSSLSHSSSSKTSLLSSPSSYMLLSLPTVDDLICHKYFIVKIVAPRHGLSLTFPPPIFKLSFCNLSSQSPRSFPFSCPRLSCHLDWLLLENSFPLNSLYIGTPAFPAIPSLSPQSAEEALNWKGWHSRRKGTLPSYTPPLPNARNPCFPNKCLKSHLHVLSSCFSSIHAWICISVISITITLVLSDSRQCPQPSQIQRLRTHSPLSLFDL